ncbi:serine hydrolase [Amycolatopsis ultiminotia]|uniref:Serine hydrolase n=1 Tax=Amycolatopsis ultiminotia TaxID=543629 RepID=A0ABP6XE11_9PSEU
MATGLRRTLAAAGLTAAVLTAGAVVATSARHVTTVALPRAAAAPPVPRSTVSSSAVSPPDLPDPGDLADSVAAAVTARSPGTEVGLAVLDRKTGRTVAGTDAATPYYSASVVKLLIALDFLYDGDSWEVPEGDDADALNDLLAGSNDAVASRLWEADGGTGIVDRMTDLLGLADTSPPSDPGQWGMTEMSPDDVVTTYQYLEDTVPDATAAPLLAALADARDPADDGYPQYFGIPDGLPDSSWQVKQGWMILRSALVLNTTGVVDSRYVVVLCTRQPAGTSSAAGRAAVTAGIEALAPGLAAWTAS